MEDIMLYQYNFDKPDLSDDLLNETGASDLFHYNHNHDPRNGQFTTGPGGVVERLSGGRSRGKKSSGGSGSISKKRKKALKKARKTRAANAKRRIKEERNKQKVSKTKEEVIKSKDIKTMLKNVDQYSDNEIRSVLNRIQAEKDLANKVKEIQNDTLGKKLKAGFKDSVSQGAKAAGKDMVKTVTKNAIKMSTKALVKKAVGNDNPEILSIIEQLFKEEKKK